MLVAMASTHSRRGDRSVLSGSSPPPLRASRSIFPPMKASRPKAIQWSTASIYWLTPLPRDSEGVQGQTEGNQQN